MTPEQIEEMNSIRWAHRIQLEPGIVTPGYYQHTTAHASSYFGMPEDLTGKTVLDIGCSDGMFSFEAEHRGATVTALDVNNPEDRCIGKAEDWPRGLRFAKRILGSRVEFREQSVYDLDGAEQWDVVLCYGLLYHLTDPIGAIRRIAAVTRETVLIETTYCDAPEGKPVWEYRPGHHGDRTNQWYCSEHGLEVALKSAGFKTVERVGHWANLERMTVNATK